MMLTTQELRTDLESKFNLLCFEDLANLLAKSPSGIYRWLKQNHRDCYAAHDRLVLYSRTAVTKNVIEHISHGLEIFDIEPFFLELYSEIKDASVMPKFHHRAISVSDARIWNGDCASLSYLCPMPWTSIQITNQGKIRPCCVFKGDLDDIARTTIKDAFHGDKYQGIRDDLISGKIPHGCTDCFKEETFNQISNRQRSLATFQNEFFLETIDDPKIKNVDIRGGITCNMKCRICNERNSSLWLAEKTKFSIDKIESDDWIKQPKNWDQLIELLPHCVNIDFFGGEPLLNKPILALFEMAKKMHVAKNIRLNINTNGSIWNQNFADFFPAFRSVNIGISIDDIKQRFELQRGSCWPTVEQNVKKFISLNNHRFHAYIYTTINIQNVYYLPELLEWANEIGADIMFSNLNYPEYLDVDRMTEAAKSLVSERLSRSSDVRLRDIAARINRSMGSDGQEFVKFMLDLDQKRQQDFGLAHREIATAMGYTV